MNLQALLASLIGGAQGAKAGNTVSEIAPSAPEETSVDVTAYEPYKRRGMFGIRGTGRDILGTLGDAFIAQGGGDPVYRPRRQMERESDALRGFVDNPLEAIRRLGRENPERMTELFDAHVDNTRLGEVAAMRRREQVLDLIGRMAGTGSAENWNVLVPQMRQYLERNPVDIPINIPDVYSDEARDALQRLGVSTYRQVDDDRTDAYQQERLEDFDEDREALGGYRDERLDDFDEDRDVRRTDPRRSAPNRNPRTPDAVAAQLILRAQRGETLNPRERQYMEWWQRDRQSRRRGGGSRRPSPGGGSQLRRRIVDGETQIFRVVNGREIRIR